MTRRVKMNYKPICKSKQFRYVPYFISSVKGAVAYNPQVENQNPTFRTINRIFKKYEVTKRTFTE